VGEAQHSSIMICSVRSGRGLDLREVRTLSPGDWGGAVLVSEGGSFGAERSNSGGAGGLVDPETDGWVEVGNEAASVRENGRDDWPSIGCILGEKGSEVMWVCSSDASEGPAIAVLDGYE
jgi:hypothetical protein